VRDVWVVKVGSLFTGYGGLDIAVGGDLAWYAEIEPAACQVLAHHYPGVPNLGDITAINWADVEPVDVITGGYPCQPFSHAGNRRGKNDVRHLWPYVLTAIRAIRPRYAILENVSGHITLGFADVLADLAEIGWSCEWGTFRASDVGAPHRRERIFIIAHADSQGLQGSPSRSSETQTRGHGHPEQGAGALAANTESERLQRREFAAKDYERKLAGRRTTSQRNCDAADTDSASGKTRTGRQGQGDTRRLQPVERGGSVDGSSTNGDTNGSDVGEIRQVQAVGTESSGVCGVNAGQVATDTDNGHGETVGGLSGLRRGHASRPDMPELSEIDWGKYAPAIRRWELTLDRNAPDPVVMRSDKRRLNPRFVEWMMGLPDGWVTGHGLSAAKELKMLGNGIVPLQAYAAITQLMQRVAP